MRYSLLERCCCGGCESCVPGLAAAEAYDARIDELVDEGYLEEVDELGEECLIEELSEFEKLLDNGERFVGLAEVDDYNSAFFVLSRERAIEQFQDGEELYFAKR